MSDLRAELEELAADLEYDVSDAPAKVRAVLAAHPAEPVLVVTDEAVAKAERAYETFGAGMRDALEAAAPLLNGAE